MTNSPLFGTIIAGLRKTAADFVRRRNTAIHIPQQINCRRASSQRSFALSGRAKLIALLLAAAAAAVLASCAGIMSPVAGFFGIDTNDYESETVTIAHEPDGEQAALLAGLTRMLSVDTITLPEFTRAKDAINICADSILYYMLRTNYAKYNGNGKLLAQVETVYPNIQVTTVIPSGDFENTVYKYFGGNEVIKHKSGAIYTYLDQAKAYTSMGQVREDEIEVVVVSLDETENTYRLTFYNRLGDRSSPVYLAVFIKRTSGDGTAYFKSLKQIAEARKSAPSMAGFE